MRRRFLLVPAAALLGLAIVAPASGSSDTQTVYTVNLSGQFQEISSKASIFIDQGTMRGSPFGKSVIKLRLVIKPKGVATETFRITAKGGSVFGTIDGT